MVESSICFYHIDEKKKPLNHVSPKFMTTSMPHLVQFVDCRFDSSPDIHIFICNKH